MNSISQFQDQYNLYLENNSFKGTPKNLYEPMNYIMSLGGKRVRPLLALMGNKLGNGDLNHGLEIAHIVETFHNFSLVHDDIMDQADLRRSKPTVHIKWNIPTAILAGDNLLVKVFEMLNLYNGPNKSEIISIVLKSATEVCEGQQNDMDFENLAKISESVYLKMIEFKTAVLLGASLQSGFLSANGNFEDSKLLYDFAINMGMAFQIMDDYLDTFSTETGKKQGGDILQGKKTWLFIKSAELDSLKHEQLFNLENSKKVDSVVNYWKEIGMDSLCIKKIESYNEHAMNDISILKEKGYHTDLLIDLLNWLKSRNS